jgi:hypothetical protein
MTCFLIEKACSQDEAEWNPGKGIALLPDYAALHPGYLAPKFPTP